MDQNTNRLLSGWITYKPTFDVVQQQWDRTVEILSRNGLDAGQLLNLVQQSEGGTPEQQSFGDHLIHKLAKAAMVVSKLGTDPKNEAWYKHNLDSVVGDLVQASEYASELPPQERSFTGCISRERGR